MIPQEKAKQLVKKFDVIHYRKLVSKPESKGLPVSMYPDQIKQCALICVDEIMKSHDIMDRVDAICPSDGYKVNSILDDEFNYWQQVKTEIEKL